MQFILGISLWTFLIWRTSYALPQPHPSERRCFPASGGSFQPTFDDLVEIRLDNFRSQYPQAHLTAITARSGFAPAPSSTQFCKVAIQYTDFIRKIDIITHLDPHTNAWSDFIERPAPCDPYRRGFQAWTWHDRGSTLQQALDKLHRLGLDSSVDVFNMIRLDQPSLPNLSAEPVYQFGRWNDHYVVGKTWIGVHDLKLIDPFGSSGEGFGLSRNDVGRNLFIEPLALSAMGNQRPISD